MEDEQVPEKEEEEKASVELKRKGGESEKKQKAEKPEKAEAAEGSKLQADLDGALRLIEEERRRNEDYLIRLKYLQADFENYRKRVDREMQEADEFSTGGLMKRLLPVLDDLDLAVSSAKWEGDSKGLAEGVAMVRKNLMSVLQSSGLRPIDAIGKPFNPAQHEAVERVDGKGKEDTVVGEIRKGYIFKNKVIRPSLVKVESALKNDGESE